MVSASQLETLNEAERQGWLKPSQAKKLQAEIERLTRQREEFKEQAERQMTLALGLRAALKDIRDEVPKCDIHFQGKVAIDIAAATLAVSSNEQ